MKLQATNVRVAGKALALMLGVGVVFGTTGCIFNNTAPTIDQTVESTISQTAQDTYLDEVFMDDNDDQASLSELSTLEGALERYDLLKEVDFGDEHYNDLSEEDKATANALSTEDIELLIEELDKDDLSIVDKSRVLQQLFYLRNDAQGEIEEKGITISTNALKRGIKAAACEATGLEAEYYDYVSIDAADQSPSVLGLTVTDPVSGASTHINVEYDSIYGKMIHQIYDLQVLDNPSFDDIREQTEESLNLVKVSAYSGVTLSGDTMTSEHSYSDVENASKAK